MMSKRKSLYRGSLKAVAMAASVLALYSNRSFAAETRAAWGSSSITAGTPVDDDALTQVSARGGIEESAVKALQVKGKLADLYSKQQAGKLHKATLDGSLGASASAEKQPVQTQLALALGSSQAVSTAVQLASIPSATPAPIPFVPVMSDPLFGLPILAAKVANGNR